MDGNWGIYREITRPFSNNFCQCNFEDLWFANENDVYGTSNSNSDSNALFDKVYVFYFERSWSNSNKIDINVLTKIINNETTSTPINGIFFARAVDQDTVCEKIRQGCRKIAIKHTGNHDLFFPEIKSQILPMMITPETIITRRRQLKKMLLESTPLVLDLLTLICSYENYYNDDLLKYDAIIKETNQKMAEINKRAFQINTLNTPYEQKIQLEQTKRDVALKAAHDEYTRLCNTIEEQYNKSKKVYCDLLNIENEKLYKLQDEHFSIGDLNRRAKFEFDTIFNIAKNDEYNYRVNTVRSKWKFENDLVAPVYNLS